VLPAERAAPLAGPDEVLFMDWRAAGAGVPSFLYAVPRPDGVLLEETCLAGRPGLPLAELRTRLLARLAAHGIEPDPDARVERVRIPLDATPPPPRPGVVRFGAAAGLVHPATGYGVARALSLAPAVAVALAGALGNGHGPRVAASRANRAVWSPAARATRSLRLLGLRALLELPAERAPAFFEAFFTLPAWARRRYLSGHDDPVGTAAAMSVLFAAVPAPVRPVLARAAFTRR
jgi:lycopene beta-cyclase